MKRQQTQLTATTCARVHHLVVTTATSHPPGGQDESLVVAVDQCHDSDGASGDAPRVLVRKALLTRVWVFKGDVKHFREVLAQMVGGGPLQEGGAWLG